MDAMRIQIIRGCDAQGQGGTVVDDASGVFAEGVLDQVAAAFQASEGLYSYPNPSFDPEQPESDSNPRTLTVSPLRNISTQLRLHGERVTQHYINSQIDAVAGQQKQAAAAALLAGRAIVENL